MGLAALALGAALAKRSALAEWLAEREFAARGVEARLRVVRLDLRGAELANVQLGVPAAPDLVLESASMSWSVAGLRAGRLDRVALRGLRLRARIDDSGAHLGALDALLASGASEAGAPLSLPFLEAELADAELSIDSPQGALRLRAEGNATPEGDLVRATFTLHGESSQGVLDFGGGGTVELASQEIGAAGALAGVTPWGHVEGNVRALGTLAALRVEFSGSSQPDERALNLRAEKPIRVSGFATRDENGVLEADLKFGASGVEWPGTGGVTSLDGGATLRAEGGVLTADATFKANGPVLTDAGSAASVSGSASLHGGIAEATLSVSDIELPDLARAKTATVRGTFDTATSAATAQIEVPHALAPDLARMEGVRAEVRWANDALAADVGVAKLVELSQPALIAPLRIEARLSGPPRRIALSGKAHTPGDGLVFEFSGTLEPADARAELKIVLPETDFAPKTRQPDRVFPWLAGTIASARGKLGGEALASYAGGALAASAVIALNGVDVSTEYGTIRGLMGVFSTTGIDPLVTPPGQTLWMKSADVGLPLSNGIIRFQLKPDELLEIERGEWGFAGGKLVFSGAIPLEATERRIALSVEGVSVEQLLAALDFDGLTGTGVLGGVTPLLQHGEQLLVMNGELHATETGVIRFTSGEGGAALTRKQPVLAPVLGALADLHYEELILTLNGDISDRVEVKMHIRGRNPNFQQGRPVALNVNVDLPLGSLLRAASVATSVPDEIEAQVQKAMGREKP